MKVTWEMDPKDVWYFEERAERAGITPGALIRQELGRRRHGRDLVDAVRERVKAGMSDADIGDELGYVVGTIAAVRRRLGLPANRRYKKG